MDDKTRVLIQIGTAAAANCVPCFNHFYAKAMNLELVDGEILEAVELGNQMKRGAQLAMNNSINEIMGGDKQRHEPCCSSSHVSGSSTDSCCD